MSTEAANSPTSISRSLYSRKQTLDVRSAMARALVTRLRALEVLLPEGGTTKFGAVYETWPDPEDAYVAPCTATVLPSPYPFEASQLTPALLEETWEPQGLPGFGLYKLAEVVADFEILIRCPTAEERRVFLAAMETAWVEPGLLMDSVNGPRYGIVLPMPEYWSVCAVFSQKSLRILDDEDRAMREHREAVLTVTGQAPQVKLDRVQPMKLSIRQSVVLSFEAFP